MNGNTEAILQIKTSSKNEIGAGCVNWHNVLALRGFLDLSSENTNYTTYNTKIQESTHIFICDFADIPAIVDIDSKSYELKTENERMLINGKIYDVMLIDNPMELNKQLEIYLKYTGG